MSAPGWQSLGDLAGRLEALFLEWSALDRATRPEFLTWAHRRRRPEARDQ